MNINVFLFFSFVFLQIERERGGVYKIGYKEKRSQSLLIFFFRRSSCGECFLFYGLIDFMLFLILAWRNGSFVSEIFLSSSFTRSTWLLITSATNSVQQLTFLLSISADGKESPLPFWGSSQSFCFYLFPSRVRWPEGGYRVQTSVPNGHSLMACYC